MTIEQEINSLLDRLYDACIVPLDNLARSRVICGDPLPLVEDICAYAEKVVNGQIEKAKAIKVDPNTCKHEGCYNPRIGYTKFVGEVNTWTPDPRNICRYHDAEATKAYLGQPHP